MLSKTHIKNQYLFRMIKNGSVNLKKKHYVLYHHCNVIEVLSELKFLTETPLNHVFGLCFLKIIRGNLNNNNAQVSTSNNRYPCMYN